PSTRARRACRRPPSGSDARGPIRPHAARSRPARTRAQASGSPSAQGSDRSPLRVIVEAPAGLPAQAARGDVLAKERTRLVAVVTETVAEPLHDRNAGVEANQVGERERAHRV